MQSFFQPPAHEHNHLPMTQRSGKLHLGNLSLDVPLCKLPDKSGYFTYFKLNDHSDLIEEAARLVAERINSLGLNNPYFVTPEASTLALAHVLRHTYKIQGTTLYKTKQLNDIDPVMIEYDSVTSTTKKTLFLGKNRVKEMLGKDIILLDSVCTTGGTLRATYQLLLKAGIASEKIIEATMLFTEGTDRVEIDIAKDVTLKVHRMGYLPIFHVPDANLNIGVVGSESQIKLTAIKDSLRQAVPNNNWNIIGVPAQSGKPEQPVEEETLEGAINRAHHALKLSPDSDLVIAIESGIFKLPDSSAAEGFSWYDKAVIYCLTKDRQSHIYYSDLVKFPTNAVEEARQGNSICLMATKPKPEDYAAFEKNVLYLFVDHAKLCYLVKDKNGKVQAGEIIERNDGIEKFSKHAVALLKNHVTQNPLLTKVIYINDPRLNEEDNKIIRTLFDITAKRGHTVRRGFDKCTVGMVFEEQGIVVSHKDPHKNLPPYKPRAEHLKKAALRLCADLFNATQPFLRETSAHLSQPQLGANL